MPGIGIFVGGGLSGIDLTRTLQHEYGHYLDYKYSSDLNTNGMSIINFYMAIGIPSIITQGLEYIPKLGVKHYNFGTEVRANQWAKIWFGKNYLGGDKYYPTEFKGVIGDWFYRH